MARFSGVAPYTWEDGPDDGSPAREFEVSFSGYYIPAKISGPPEDCYPEEGELEVNEIIEVLPGGAHKTITEAEFKTITGKEASDVASAYQAKDWRW